MRKLYRSRRGGLVDIMNTSMEVNDVKDILRYENNNMYSHLGISKYFGDNIYSEYYADDSERLGEEWKDTYIVMINYGNYNVVLGFCNFKIEKSDTSCKPSK